MSDSLKTLLVIAFLIVIVWNLGAGLYYLMIDRGQTKRTVNALTKRIALSVADDVHLIRSGKVVMSEPAARCTLPSRAMREP